jgi:hypothetical protein
MLGRNGGDIPRECLDRGETLVSSSGSAATLHLQRAEEGADDLCVEHGEVEGDWRSAEKLTRVGKEELQRISVGQDCVATDVALDDEVLLEERLDQRREGRS